MSYLNRFWNAIKLPPSVPRPEWAQEPPSAWKRLLHSLRPPPAVSASGELMPAGVVRRRRLIGIYTVAGLALLVGGWELFRYIRSAPQRAEASLQEGLRLAASGNQKSAADRMTRAIAINPLSADAFLQRGLVRQSLNQPGAAMEDIQQAIALNPKMAAAHVALSGLYREAGDLQRALAELSTALNLEQNVEAYYQRGQIYQTIGDHRKAIADFNAGVSVLPEAPYLYRARATSELALGDRQAALRDRRKASGIEHHLGASPEDEP